MYEEEETRCLDDGEEERLWGGARSKILGFKVER